MNKSNIAIIVAHERGYRANAAGDFFSPAGTKLKKSFNNRYLRFSLITGGEKLTFKIHRFIAYYKFGDGLFQDGIQVRHLDGDPLNNSWDNIAIGTASENRMDIPEKERLRLTKNAAKKLRKLTYEQAEELRKDRKNGLKYKDLVKKYNIARGAAQRIVNKETYVDVV